MSTLFISTSKPPQLDQGINYRIDPVEYHAKMQENWPYARIYNAHVGDYILSWELNNDKNLGASGGLQANRLVVSLSSNPQRDAVDFILWHRSFVPNIQQLFLFDESLTMIVELEPDLTEETIQKLIR